MKQFLLPMLAVMSLIGCASASGEPGGSISDSLTFSGAVIVREPTQLPAGSTLTVALQDVSLADAPAVTLARTQIELSGQQTPIPFAMSYSRSAVNPRAVYSAQARIALGDRLLFITTQHNRVDALTPSPMDLLVSPVQSPRAPATPDVPLSDTYWKLIEVQGQPIQMTESMREPSLVLHGGDGRFAGSGGVNRLMGGYTVDGTSVVFSNSASTMMAGPPEAMQQEQAIIAALQRVRAFRITGDQLTLVDESNRPVVKAAAVALS